MLTNSMTPAVRTPYPTSNVAAGASGDVVVQTMTVEQLRAKAAGLVESEQWALLLNLASHTPDFISDTDTATARYLLKSLQIVALTKADEAKVPSFNKHEKGRLRTALAEMAVTIPQFHTRDEFELYLTVFDTERVEDNLRVQRSLVEACRQTTDFRRIEQLRRVTFRLLGFKPNGIRRRMSEREQLLGEAQPTLLAALEKVYHAAEASSFEYAADDRHKLLMFTSELRILLLDTPVTLEALGECFSVLDPTGGTSGVATRPWQFLWGVSCANWATLRTQATSNFGGDGAGLTDDLSDGLNVLMLSVFMDDGAIRDKWFVKAVSMLSRYALSGDWPRRPFHVEEGGATRSVEVDPPLYAPHPTALISHLVALCEGRFERFDELVLFERCFYKALGVSHPNRKFLPDMVESWLGRASATFCLMMAEVGKSAYQKIRFHLAAGRASDVETGAGGARVPWISEDVEEGERQKTLDALSIFIERTEELGSVAASLWKLQQVNLLSTLINARGESASRLSSLLELCEPTLSASANGRFLRAHVYSNSGQPVLALEGYLASYSPQRFEQILRCVDMLILFTNDRTALTQFPGILTKHQETFPEQAQWVSEAARSTAEKLERLEQADRQVDTAAERFSALSFHARKLLTVMAQVGCDIDTDELAVRSEMSEKWTRHHCSSLRQNGMLVFEGKGWAINPKVRPLIAVDRVSKPETKPVVKSAVTGRLIKRSGGTAAKKQVFNSQLEYDIYKIIIELCPNCLVFPNCSLQSIMSYETMKSLVDSEDFGFFLRSSVDVLVVSTATYLPMFAIEVDSLYHHNTVQVHRDERKDRLFGLAGIPLLRLEPHSGFDPLQLRKEVARLVAEAVAAANEQTEGE